MTKRIMQDKAAHGELYLMRANELPESGITRTELAQGEHLVLAHSDSGHHHYIGARCVPKIEYYTVDGARDDTSLRAYLVVKDDSNVVLQHKKQPPHGHKDIYLKKGGYRIKRRLAYNPWTDTWGRTSD